MMYSLVTDGRSPVADGRLRVVRCAHFSISSRRSVIGLRLRSGYTLLEVILSLSLALLLMAALYTALKLHLTMSQKGPEGVQRAQMARAVLQRIARDVQAALPQAPAAAPSGSAGSTPSQGSTASATSGASSTASSDAAATAEPDPYAAAFGLIGGSDWIDIYIAQPRADLDDAESIVAGGAAAQASSVVRVSYALTALSMRPDSTGRSVRFAIARTQVPAIAAEQFDTASDESDYRAATDIVAADVGYLEFQYWDDATGEWVDSWGSDTPIAPPRAVKVFISLLQPDEFLSEQLGVTGGQSTWTPNYQLVIPIATWDSNPAGTGTETTGG